MHTYEAILYIFTTYNWNIRYNKPLYFDKLFGKSVNAKANLHFNNEDLIRVLASMCTDSTEGWKFMQMKLRSTCRPNGGSFVDALELYCFEINKREPICNQWVNIISHACPSYCRYKSVYSTLHFSALCVGYISNVLM